MGLVAARIALALGIVALFAAGTGCSSHNSLVCCVAADDCAAIGVTTPEPCSDGLVCVMNSCTLPTDAGPDAPVDAPTCSPSCSGPTPYCSPSQTCVECLTSSECPSSKPTCDAATLSCRGCQADGECGSNVCDETSGTCVSPSLVAYASPIGSDSATCTQSDPCSITHAFFVLNASRQTLSLAPGTYAAGLSVQNQTISIHGTGATLNATGNVPALDVTNNGHALVAGVAFSKLDNNVAPLYCDPTTGTATLALDHVSTDTAGPAVVANGCTLLSITRSKLHDRNATSFIVLVASGSATIDRSTLDGGDGVNTTTASASLHITNSVLSNMTGADGAATGANGSLFISFSTIINSLVKCTTGTPVCVGGSTSGVCIDNSIVYNANGPAGTDTVTGSACQASYTLVYPQSTAVTGTNNKLGTLPSFVDPATGDYHLKSTSPAVNAADPAATDPDDYDGTARPQGGRSDLGAFEYK